VALGAVAIAGLLAACGGSSNDETTTTSAGGATTTSSGTATTPPATSTSGGATTGEGSTTAPSTSTGVGGGTATAGDWAAPNGDWSNTRDVPGSDIAKATVSGLQPAWKVPIKGTGTFGSYASTPIILDGVVYTQDLRSNVQAIDEASGKVLWTHDFDSSSVGPNGVAVADGRVYGATANSAFALDAKTGDQLWLVKLTRNANEGIDMAPGVHGDLVYVSTVPGNSSSFYKGNGQGVLFALDGATGATKWKFATVPASLWGDPQVNSGGGLWHPPAFDDQGSMYVDIANPAPFPGTQAKPWGSSRPGPDPDSDTIVKLNDETGQVQWKNQVIAHDVYDWDLHLPPMLVDTSSGQHLVVAGGKMGYVYAFDRDSGKLLWKTPVGKHNGHDNDHELALQGKLSALPKLPLTVYPGALGGVETQMAVADGTVYAPVVNVATIYKKQDSYSLDLAHGTGEMDALDLASGKVLWTHKFTTPTYGAATVVNDLVFTTTFDGTLHALDAKSGAEVWSSKLPAGTNATVAVAGDTLVTAASYPQGASQQAVVMAYTLGGSAAGSAGTTGTTGTDSGAATTTQPASTAGSETTTEPSASTTAPTTSTAGTDTTSGSPTP
jgi:outer membrane protein assembly factor BamB